MKVLIVDDEALARDRLKQLIERLAGYQVVGEAANGVEALTLTATEYPDVVLMDIRMPKMDGLEAARHLSRLDTPPAVIFTTAYNQHALAAFQASATDYLLKPVRHEHLETALHKARKLNRMQVDALATANQASARTHISANMRGGLKLVPVEEILCLKAEQKYVNVYYFGGEVLLEESLKTLEEEFAERFLRIHRNALVACAYLEGLEKDAAGHCRVRLRGLGQALEVSRRHLPEVRRRLKNL
jgi:two-component system response regulator AlgR